MRKTFMAILGLCLISSLYGCAALVVGAAAGGGTAVWLTGKLTEDVNASFDKTVSASKKALDQMDFLVLEEKKTFEQTSLKSKYMDGDSIWIDVTPVTQKLTKVEIRVGVPGNEAACREILAKIKKNL